MTREANVSTRNSCCVMLEMYDVICLEKASECVILSVLDFLNHPYLKDFEPLFLWYFQWFKLFEHS